MAAELPNTIQRYQDAHDGHDVDGALAAFAADAVVRDEGQQWLGTTEIRKWLSKTSTEFTFTRTLISVEATGSSSWEVRNRLEGNFPGKVVDLRYRFELDGDQIVSLTIAP
jgi:hypothetical protein